ncbi:sugar kinase [Paenibacillus sp. NAIST15-1]|uniref:sugar kinase n=1 Tax=Paenibacillus sp. NAIST15-1 TaxID=1605994 RepID=UPI00086E6DE7|nr:sugar kinase [Paenibacillus sp. NAIST15-1]GAV14647.1 carbohydrate kinase [Paenibacillus sp. NAIST15-1]
MPNVPKLGMKKVAAFGEVMMRLTVPGVERLSQASHLDYSFSGTGVNVSSQLARFGHDAYLISRLPDNPLGEAAEAYLRKLGIGTAFISHGGKYIGMYFLEQGFGPRPGRVTYTDRLGSSFNTAPDDVYPYSEIAGSIDAIHFCGIALAMNDGVRQHMKALAAAVKAAGGTVIFDCNYRPAHWGEEGYVKARAHYEEMLRFADIVMMNEKDAMLTLGMETEKTERREQLEELIPRVAKLYNISVIAGTHRAIHENQTHSLQGFMYKQESFTFSERLTFAVHDRIGAGDAYTCGILHGEFQGFAPEQTVEFAAASSMLAHTFEGDTPMATEREVLRAMVESGIDVER